jgi:dihydrofolate synthase/folylpolyglutamate synthase
VPRKQSASPANPRKRNAQPATTEDPAILEDLAIIYAEIISRNPEHDFDPTLDRVKRVCELLGDPQHAFHAVHITGTNGKTSTARMTESLIREHGLRTGLFTSPHLQSVTERIQIDGEPISAQAFVDTWNDIAPYIGVADRESQEAGGPRLSFFEVLTVMAYAAFADAPVDVAVIEVGMGGEWDSTNVINAATVILTPIDIDHQKWLGSSIEEIAATKAGIIKPGATVISAIQRDEASAIIRHKADDERARLLVEGQNLTVLQRTLAVGGQLLTLQTPAGIYQDVFVPLHGEHQAHNALLALAAAEAVLTGGSALNAERVEQGLAQVTSPGRLELLRSSPTIIADVAHNPHGATALAEALNEAFGFRHLVGVIGILGDKDAESIFAALEPALGSVVLTRNSSPRCADPVDLLPIAREIFDVDDVYLEERLDDALQKATDLAEADDTVGVGTGTGILVTGSVITVADARTLLGVK